MKLFRKIKLKAFQAVHKKLLESFLVKKISKRGKEKQVIAGLELGKDLLKLSQAEESPEGKKVIKCFTEKIGSLSDEQISGVIRVLFEELKIKPKTLLTSIPRASVTVRCLKFPSTDQKEIAEMVGFQAAKQLPYPREEIIFDHQIIGKDKGGYSKVMLVVLHRDVVRRHLKILRDANIEPDRIALSSEATYRWFQFNQASGGKAPERTVILLDFDSHSTEIEIISGGSLVFTRNISLGADDLPQAQDKLIEELKRSLAAYQKDETGGEPSGIILAGATQNLKDLGATLEKEFSLSVEVIAPLEDMPVSFTAVRGLVTSRDRLKINLLPKDVQETHKHLARKRELISTGVLVIFVLVAGSGVLSKKLYDKGRYLRVLDRELQKTDLQANNLEKMRRQLKVIKSQMSMEGSSLDILRELYKVIPKELSLTAFTFEQGRMVILNGMSKSMADVFKFVTTLEKSSHFQNVQVKYTTKRKTRGAELTDFQINCPLVAGKGSSE